MNCGGLMACCNQPQPPSDGGREPSSHDHDRHRRVRLSVWSVWKDVHRKSGSSRFDFLPLILGSAEVRSEIGLDDQEFARVRQIDDQLRKQIQELDKQNAQSTSRDKFIDMIAEEIVRNDAELFAYLGENSDFERLLGILVNIRSHRSVLNTLVADRIGLSAEKLAELRNLSGDIWKEEMEKVRDTVRSIPRQDKVRIDDIFEQVGKKLDIALKLKLTSQQLEALSKLRGQPFAVPADLRLPPPPPQFRGRFEGGHDRRDGSETGRNALNSDESNRT
jgi:hypothetical protein